MRAGYTCFAISPRNSPEAVAHLLTASETALLLVSSEFSMVALGESALKMMRGKVPPMHHMPVFEDLFTSAMDPAFVTYPEVKYDPESIALILHSSGSYRLKIRV